MNNAIAGLLIGGSLFYVAINGKAVDLINELKKETGFLKWAVAVWILYMLIKSKTFGNVGKSIGILAFLGFGIMAAGNPKLQENINKLIG